MELLEEKLQSYQTSVQETLQGLQERIQALEAAPLAQVQPEEGKEEIPAQVPSEAPQPKNETPLSEGLSGLALQKKLGISNISKWKKRKREGKGAPKGSEDEWANFLRWELHSDEKWYPVNDGV